MNVKICERFRCVYETAAGSHMMDGCSSGTISCMGKYETRAKQECAENELIHQLLCLNEQLTCGRRRRRQCVGDTEHAIKMPIQK